MPQSVVCGTATGCPHSFASERPRRIHRRLEQVGDQVAERSAFNVAALEQLLMERSGHRCCYANGPTLQTGEAAGGVWHGVLVVVGHGLGRAAGKRQRGASGRSSADAVLLSNRAR